MQFGNPGVDEDIAAAIKASWQDDDAEFGEEFKQALMLSMKEQSALELVRCEVSPALATVQDCYGRESVCAAWPGPVAYALPTRCCERPAVCVQEKAELEQALALSAALELEHMRLASSAPVAPTAAAAAPAPFPVPDAQAPASTLSPLPARPTADPTPAPAARAAAAPVPSSKALAAAWATALNPLATQAPPTAFDVPAGSWQPPAEAPAADRRVFGL